MSDSSFTEAGTVRYPSFTFTDRDGDYVTVECTSTSGELIISTGSRGDAGPAVLVRPEHRVEFLRRINELKSRIPCGTCDGKGYRAE